MWVIKYRIWGSGHSFGRRQDLHSHIVWHFSNNLFMFVEFFNTIKTTHRDIKPLLKTVSIIAQQPSHQITFYIVQLSAGQQNYLVKYVGHSPSQHDGFWPLFEGMNMNFKWQTCNFWIVDEQSYHSWIMINPIYKIHLHSHTRLISTHRMDNSLGFNKSVMVW